MALRDILLRSNQGRAFIQNPDGGIRTLLNAKKIEASFKIESFEYLELGKILYENYPGAVKIQGSMDLYICSSYYIEKIIEYTEGGDPFYFDLHVEVGTASSKGLNSIGVQHVLLKDVLLSQVPIFSLGQDASASSGNFDFSANKIRLTKKFNDSSFTEVRK